MGSGHCMARESWELEFQADPQEVAALRRIVRLHLSHWELPDLIERAQLCVSELVTNVIRHVGAGTPSRLTMSMRGTYVRVEVRDPDGRALPAVLRKEVDAESGRGMALIDAVAEQWGVAPDGSGKVTWCELATDLLTPDGHASGERIDRAERVLRQYGTVHVSAADDAPSVPAARGDEESAVRLSTGSGCTAGTRTKRSTTPVRALRLGCRTAAGESDDAREAGFSPSRLSGYVQGCFGNDCGGQEGCYEVRLCRVVDGPFLGRRLAASSRTCASGGPVRDG
ncbi:ATP-binding protein [Streptomyces sp. NPDC048845]|uniref:ATP-binding protein n=1 Tax=Streptomyces sp. NPDC048845 TaxID=3155390 RepID=UPI00341A5F21